MAFEYLTTGSVFLGAIFASLISPKESNPLVNTSISDFYQLVEKSKNILRENNYIDAPLIINKLGVNAEIANLIINELIKQGLIRKIDN